MVGHRRGVGCHGIRVVAIAAGHGNVATFEREASLLVPRERESRWPVTLHGVAALATVQQRRPGELSSVLVRVTVQALRELGVILRPFALRQVALCAGDDDVPPFQGIFRRRVLANSKPRRLEPFDGVAGGALSAVRPSAELSAMRVRRVAIHTLLVGYRFLEISAHVAPAAPHRGMFSKQRKSRLRMIESSCHRDVLPPRSRVARLTGIGEGPAVDIGVARRAGVEADSLELQ